MSLVADILSRFDQALEWSADLALDDDGTAATVAAGAAPLTAEFED